GKHARHPRGLRLSRRAEQRRFRFHRGRRQQLRRISRGAADRAPAGEVARLACAGALQGFGVVAEEEPPEARTGTRGLSSPTRASRRKPRAPRVPRVHRRCLNYRVRARLACSAPGHRELPGGVHRREVESTHGEALISAKSTTYRVISGADHALSDDASQRAYSTNLVTWLSEMVLGARSPEPAAPTPSPKASTTTPPAARRPTAAQTTAGKASVAEPLEPRR